jgi:hypothetical protein
MELTINQKLLRQELGGGDVISTLEMVEHLYEMAQDERPGLECRFLTAVADRRNLYLKERKARALAPARSPEEA